MANDLLKRPIKIDTAMANFAKTDDTTRKSSYWVKKVYWFNPTTIAHTFQIVGKAGNVLLEGRCEVANQSQIFEFLGDNEEWSDFKVGTLSSGTLYIYTQPNYKRGVK